MRYLQKVLAGLSPILYHYSPIQDAAAILRENRFVLPTFLGSSSDKVLSKGKMYYLSMSRQKAGGYHLEANEGVVFVLEGKKLAHRHKGTPFDYWGEEWRQNAKKSGGLEQYLHLDENEDRLLTDKPAIEDAADYIKSVHVLFGFKDNPHVVEGVREVLKYSKMHKLPVYVYEDKKHFLLQDTRNAIPFSKLREDLVINEERSKPFSSKLKVNNPFRRYLKIYYAKRKSDLHYTDLGPLGFGGADSLDALIHNHKKDKKTRKYLEEFLSLWKTLGAKNSKEFLAKLSDRYESLAP